MIAQMVPWAKVYAKSGRNSRVVKAKHLDKPLMVCYNDSNILKQKGDSMPEAGPHNPEYKQHHPNAIEDRDKAEVMARASKQQEEFVVQRGKVAESFVDEYADNSGRVAGGEDADRSMQSAANAVRDAAIWRQEADKRATEAGELYDSVNQLTDQAKSGGPVLPEEYKSEVE